MFHFDATGISKTTISDLNWSKLDRYFDQYGVDFSNESDKERLLANTDIMTPEGELTVAFRELIVNACLHRNYAILGSRIRVFLFNDRLEVRSPGRLPNTITPEKMKFGVSYASNPVLLKYMENLRYIDKLGRGIPMVYQEAKRNNKILGLEEMGEEFIITLEL